MFLKKKNIIRSEILDVGKNLKERQYHKSFYCKRANNLLNSTLGDIKTKLYGTDTSKEWQTTDGSNSTRVCLQKGGRDGDRVLG